MEPVVTPGGTATGLIVQPDDGGLPPEAREELQRALDLLRSGGGGLARAMARAARLAGLASSPLLRGFGASGQALQPVIQRVMQRAFDLAIVGQRETAHLASPRRAQMAAIASGIAGGLTGLPGFLPDAAFTTLLILRNIAAIAREHGEDPADEATRRACLEVFLLGGPRHSGDPAAMTEGDETGYFAARLMLQGGPLVAVLQQAAARFGVVLTEKLATQAVPLVGAAGGAMINAAFLSHYRAIARAHFAIRRLERCFGIGTLRRSVTQALTNQSVT